MRKMISLVISLVLMIVAPINVFLHDSLAASAEPVQSSKLIGPWRVKFDFRGVGENSLLFDSQPNGSGTFLLTPRPDGKSESTGHPAIWSETTNDRVSFSGDVELQLGNCCREMGTLIFKGKFDSSNSISGRAIFVGSTIDEENFNGFRSTVGTFKAIRLSK